MSNPQYAHHGADPSSSGHDYSPQPPPKLPSLDMPKFEATFVPGGFDDYYMPEVIAPSPQRVMPEVPQNMQEDLQRLEREAYPPTSPNKPDFLDAPSSRQVYHQQPPPQEEPQQTRAREPSLSSYLGASAARAAGAAGPAIPAGPAASSVAANTPPPQQQQQQQQQPQQPQSQPQQAQQAQQAQQPPSAATPGTFKPFVLANRDSMAAFEVPTFSPFPRISQGNVPPSDDEKERILYNARQDVLKSNNVAVQLDWALDVLSWVEISQEAYAREHKDQGGRPKTPRIEHELRVDAINIVEYLASQNHPQALFARAKWLEFGKFNFRQDKNEAFLGYMNAASRGWGRAEYRMGMIYENANDVKNALLHYNRGLELHDSASSYRLGMMNLLGQHGHPKDYQAGLDLIRAAADTSDEESPQGAYVFGMLIARELPDINIPEGMLPPDLAQARQYIEKSAYFGFAKAQLKMGQAYELCQLGCDFNPALSLHYYGLAAHQGQPEAALGVSRWFLFGYEGVFLKNEQLAFKYAQLAADAKLASGEFALGYYYEIGIYVQKDLRDARQWYERAADHGNQDAVGRLEALNQAKTLTKQDHETTALTRIKSKHGSMRSQRPERFSSRQKDGGPSSSAGGGGGGGGLPAVSETAADTDAPTMPALPTPPTLPTLPNLPQPASTTSSPMPSPDYPPSSADRRSPSHRPLSAAPDASRPPAFAVNIDQSGLALRPKSTAPYPVDDKPAPLNLLRPKSTAPYPDDGRDPLSAIGGRTAPLSPHYNPQIRPSNGQPTTAERPLSAFGIRPVSMTPQPGGGPRPLSVSQTMGNLAPEQRPFSVNLATRPPPDSERRGRIVSAGWEPQRPASGGAGGGDPPYRGPSPGRADYGYPSQQQQQLPPGSRLSGGMPPPADSNGGRNRLSKANPNAGPNPNPNLAPAAQPGRDYGPRTSSRPVSSVYPGPSNGGGGGGGRPDRLDSLPSQAHGRFPSGGGGGGGSGGGGGGAGGYSGRPPYAADGAPQRPVSAAGLPPRVSSAAPPQQAGPGGPRPPAQPAAQPAKPVKQGPATFEEMGIPQGKGDDDCCIM